MGKRTLGKTYLLLVVLLTLFFGWLLWFKLWFFMNGYTSRVSLDSLGAWYVEPALFPTISSDGRFVTFEANAFLQGPVRLASPGYFFLYDRLKAIARPFNGHGAIISSNGRFIAYASSVSIHVYDREEDSTDLISPEAIEGTDIIGPFDSPSISADGRYVAFASLARDPITAYSTGQSDIYIFDRLARESSRASITSDGNRAMGISGMPAISGDGSLVAYLSDAGNLTGAVDKKVTGLFIHDRLSGGTDLIDRVIDGPLEGLGAFYPPSLSFDGVLSRLLR